MTTYVCFLFIVVMYAVVLCANGFTGCTVMGHFECRFQRMNPFLRSHHGGQLGHHGGQMGHHGGQMGHQGGQMGHQGGQMGHQVGPMGHQGGQMGHQGGQMGHQGGQMGQHGQMGHPYFPPFPFPIPPVTRKHFYDPRFPVFPGPLHQLFPGYSGVHPPFSSSGPHCCCKEYHMLPECVDYHCKIHSHNMVYY